MNPKKLKVELLKIRKNATASLKDIKLLIECFKSEDFEPMFNTILYNKKSCEYCSLLEIINQNL